MMDDIVELGTGAEWALSAAYTSANTERIVVADNVSLFFMADFRSESRRERISIVSVVVYLLKVRARHREGSSALFNGLNIISSKY